MFFCAAGDPGGSRAILPVIDELFCRNIPCRVLDHGFLGAELPGQYGNMLLSPYDMEQDLLGCTAFLFGSSTNDALPLSLAHKAKACGKPIAHVLDNWASYRTRLTTSGGELLIPDLYAVMDEAAYDDAVAEGIPAHCLAVTGHPGFAAVAPSLRALRCGNRQAAASRLGLPTDTCLVAFVCEPFTEIFGPDVAAPGHPGFTQETVLPAFASALTPYAKSVYVVLLPHPKQTLQAVKALWEKCRGPLRGSVVKLAQGRDILSAVHGVAGMASILLYEAWLAGLPVLAMQPGVRSSALKRFASFEGIVYVNESWAIEPTIPLWLEKCVAKERGSARPELERHEKAPALIVNLLMQLARL